MKKYRLIIIDDEKEIISGILDTVSTLINLENGYEIKVKVLSTESEVNKMNDFAADIVLFDCALGASDLVIGNEEETTYGLNLMRKFRENNNKTKIIFYSGGFKLNGSQCYDFTNQEIIEIINNIHVFKMIPKKVECIVAAILEAINELDAIIVSLEDLKYEYNSHGEFLVGEETYTIENMLDELKRGSKAGDEFRKSIIYNILTYMMKFGGDEED